MPSHSERQSSAYPWLTIMAEGHVYADTRDCTPAELDRRMVIMQEISAGRLVLAEDAPRDTDDTTWIVLWVARCSRCNGTVDDDGGEYEEDACPACEGTGFGVATDEKEETGV